MLPPSKLAMSILLFGLTTLSTILAVGLSAQDPRRVVFDNGAFFGTSTPLPVWDNGYLISWDIETFQAGTPNVRLYDSSGNPVRTASIWFPDAARVLVYSASGTQKAESLPVDRPRSGTARPRGSSFGLTWATR